MNRRDAVHTLGGLMAAAAFPWARSAVSVEARAARRSSDRLERIGLQLYTVRRELARDFEGTLARVAAIGYHEVEFAGYFDRPPAAVKAALVASGLAAPAAHVPFPADEAAWHRSLEDAMGIGHDDVVVPWIPAEWRGSADDYRRVAEWFNRLGDAARDSGLRFAYHNHDFEFGGVDHHVPYDLLLAHTDPTLVAFEMDLYWITKGGGDPLTYFARHPGRFRLVHVKDSAGPPEHRMVDVGKGTINFARIFSQRDAAGIRHFFVEHDNPGSPFDSVATSYRYLESLEF